MAENIYQTEVQDESIKALLDEIYSMSPESEKVSGPEKVVAQFLPWAYASQERFLLMTLDGSHGIISVSEVSIGTANKTFISCRDVFRRAVIDNACAIIVGHNHPSGSFEPSQEDKALTKKIVEAGGLMGIPVLDHVIVSRKGHFSFLENGLL